MPDFRRGTGAITQAQESNKKGGSFTPFAPTIIWPQHQDEKYIVFLNPAEEIPTVEYHEWIVTGTRANGKPNYESFLSRKDPAIGESADDIEDRLGQKARLRTIAVAVELEPTFELVKGRQRPTGFRVKTDTYDRKTDDGTVEVTYPVVGLVVQSPLNFFGWVGSFNETTAPIEETPLHVVRRGKDKNTAYDFTPYIDQTVDFTPLVEHVSGINYLRDEIEGVVTAIEALDTAEEAAQYIGGLILEKRLDELADPDRYERLIGPIEQLENKWGQASKPATKVDRPVRPTRPSPRAAASEPAETAVAPATRESKFARLRAATEAASK